MTIPSDVPVSPFPSSDTELQALLEPLFLREKSALAKQWYGLQKRQQSGQPIDKGIAKFLTRLHSAQEAVANKKANAPEVSFPEQLPVSHKKDEIAKVISENQVVVIAGETGSGKTTQIPKICLELGRGLTGKIGHTQPRRIAASTVAKRIADELQVPLGEAVGYQVRFTDQSTDASFIKLMTDGILLAEVQNDPLLYQYDTLIIDEAHERSLNIDFLLGYLKRILPKRPDLKLIVTSATIDLERFSKHFNDAPIVEVSGRTYPVEVLYRPPASTEVDTTEQILEAVEEILTLPQGGGGDILVFLSGERDIREIAKALRDANLKHLEVLPLYARLSMAEQTRVFAPHKGRRVVLATNVAETSITVPGIGYVIDPGFARISRYSVRTKVQRLPIEPISQASANQRAGRCGRVSNGVCIRLYSQEDFESRPEFTDAEILRTNLASVVLQMLSMGVGDIRHFPFVDPPEHKQIKDGYALLEELQAVNPKGQLTNIGRQLTKLPLDPRLGRMLIAAAQQGSLKEVLIIAAALSAQDPRERPAEKQQASDEKHRRFWDEQSDFLAYVNLWQYVEEQRQVYSQNQWRKQSAKEYLNFLRLREWRELHHQMRVAVKALNFKENQEPADYDAVHKALLTGLLSNVAVKNDEKAEYEYLGTRNRKLAIFPGSSLFKKRPKWFMASQMLETSKLFAHSIARIEPDWVLSAAKHLVKHHYHEPHYNSKSGQVMGFDRITLLGLVLTEKQRVNYSHVDAKVARDVFIRSALVEGAYERSKGERSKGAAKPIAPQQVDNDKSLHNKPVHDKPAHNKPIRKNAAPRFALGHFFVTNKKSIEEVTALEAKSRRRDILINDEAIYQFYDERIPAKVVNLAGFEHWRKEAEQSAPDVLIMPKSWLMQHAANDITEAQFPNSLTVDGMELPLFYHFEPGHPDDGVSIGIPVSVLHSIPEARLEWVIPGLLRDKCIALVKALPKQWRKRFVPVPDYVDKALARLTPSNKPLSEALSLELQRHIGQALPADIWDDVIVEDYYRLNIHLLDDNGKVLERGRDITLLRSQYKERVQTSIQTAGENVERENITGWDFGTWQKETILKKGAVKVKAYPALVNEPDGIALRVLDNPVDAAQHTLRGVVALLARKLHTTVKYLQKDLLKNKDIGLTVVKLGTRADVVNDMVHAAIKTCCVSDGEIPINAEEFEAACARATDLILVANEYQALLLTSLKQVVGIKKAMKSNKHALTMTFTYSDINQQLSELFYSGFLFEVPLEWLRQYPRYLSAIEQRLEKAPLNVQKDKLSISVLNKCWGQHADRLEKEGSAAYANNQLWQQYRWMMEELRVSLFAQSLKTRTPVSEKRLKKVWEESLA